MSHIPFIFLASLPWGSPLVRWEVHNVQRGMSNYVASRLRKKTDVRPPEVQWRDLFSTKALENYEIGRPAGLFFQTVAPFSIIEYFILEEGAGDLTG
ncbi:MAG: hypothetical protein HC902_13935, partial [Calothrix sp. SM1_5_4]|nr:hypothetical protein [Calothrix sp. SM1_5_4]